MGIVGGLVFIAALIAFVLVPRQATRAAVSVSAVEVPAIDSDRWISVASALTLSATSDEAVTSVVRASRAPAVMSGPFALPAR